MREKGYFFTILFLLIVPTFVATTMVNEVLAQGGEPIVPSEPSNVYIEEIAEYDAPIGDSRPIVHLSGILFWERLAGIALYFYINTSDIIDFQFWDHDTGNSLPESDTCFDPLSFESGCIVDDGDKFIIKPEKKSFEYTIDAYYDPDIIEDTGMIVIFNSQSVDFSLEVDGEQVFAKVDYRNEIILPQNAYVVSRAPIDDGMEPLDFREDGRVRLVWEYKNRAMDSKHDPLMIEVTYSYDQIYLAFNQQIYQQQQSQKERQEEEQKLDLLNASFIVIATLAVLASIISVLFAYLLARKRFEPKLNKAKELPRRSVTDIERSPSQKIPIKSMFLSMIIIIPFFMAPIPIQAQTDIDNIGMNVTMDLGKEPFVLIERTVMEMPVAKEYVYIYTNTSEVINFNAYDENGNTLRTEIEENRYKVFDPSFYFVYEIERPYKVYDHAGILVFMDRIWSEFVMPPEAQTADDIYFNVDLKYSIILPADAYLYSASPSDLMAISTTNTGRWNVTFTSDDRNMDAFHDVFEMQITFSFVDILEALENLNADFQKDRVEIQNTQDLIDTVRDEILLFSLLGLIAPLISFMIAYWVFRRRYQKLIERTERQQEENIFVEDAQIAALTLSLESTENDMAKSFIGHYWRVIRRISELVNRDISLLDNQRILIEMDKKGINVDKALLTDILTRGQEVSEEDEITYEDLFEYANQVDLLFEEME